MRCPDDFLELITCWYSLVPFLFALDYVYMFKRKQNVYAYTFEWKNCKMFWASYVYLLLFIAKNGWKITEAKTREVSTKITSLDKESIAFVVR